MKLKLSEIAKLEELTLINEIFEDRTIGDVNIGDLLSHVMSNGRENAIWLTVQRHINVIAVAELNDFVGIVFVEGVEPDVETVNKANELQIPLFKTSLGAFDVGRLFFKLGM